MTAQASAAPTVEPRRSRRAAAHARPTEGQPAARRDRDRDRDKDRAGRTRRPILTPRSVRARIVCLLALPVVSLTSLWGIAAVDTISSAFDQSQLHALDSSVAMPLADTVNALQQERSAAAAYLEAHNADPTSFEARINATRSQLSTLQTGIDQSAAAAGDLGNSLTGQLSAATRAMDALTSVRTAVLGHATTPTAAYQAYSAAIDDAFAVDSTLAGASGAPNTAPAALALSEAREQLSVQDAVISGAEAAGTLNAASYQQFVGAVYAERTYLRQASATLPDPTANTTGAQLAALQNAVVADGPGTAGQAAASAQGWSNAAPTVLAGLESTARAASTPAAADPYRQLLTTGSGLGVLLGFFALTVSLLISVGIGRRLVTDLVGLRDYALDLAGRKLPDTMARLRAGQLVEPGEQAPPLDPDAGELGQVAEALAVASRAAMQAAVERAELVSGVSGVFLNLARRSQVLVHRQLALLDTMERRIEEPDHLEDLFRLDHLATRMRRHAEGLIILSGATPGRAWRHPVDLTDVVRAAAAEAEDYERVEVRRMPRARVLGPVVADLTHLLAELVENATSFSPPHTRVVVGGEPVGSGFAIEIEDRGLGMSPEALREANRRIGESSGDDLFDSDRLGLFVVSRLARRHDVRVSLCASAYGGITAVVLIPSTVMQPPGDESAPPTAEHDLGVSGAMSHGPLVDPGRMDPTVHVDGFDPASSSGASSASTSSGASAASGVGDSLGASGAGNPARATNTGNPGRRRVAGADGAAGAVGAGRPSGGADHAAAPGGVTPGGPMSSGDLGMTGSINLDPVDAAFSASRPGRPGEPGAPGQADGRPGHGRGQGHAGTQDSAGAADGGPHEGRPEHGRDHERGLQGHEVPGGLGGADRPGGIGASGMPGGPGMPGAPGGPGAPGVPGGPGSPLRGLSSTPPVPHTNGHTTTSDSAHPRRFDVLVPPPRPQGAGEDSGPFAPLGPDGLPRRVRQANLAPQLRADTAEEPGGDQAARRPRSRRAPRPQRTPEQNRATMSAFQRGFTRGRADEPDAPPSPMPQPATEADGRPADHDDRGEGPR